MSEPTQSPALRGARKVAQARTTSVPQVSSSSTRAGASGGHPPPGFPHPGFPHPGFPQGPHPGFAHPSYAPWAPPMPFPPGFVPQGGPYRYGERLAPPPSAPPHASSKANAKPARVPLASITLNLGEPAATKPKTKAKAKAGPRSVQPSSAVAAPDGLHLVDRSYDEPPSAHPYSLAVVAWHPKPALPPTGTSPAAVEPSTKPLKYGGFFEESDDESAEPTCPAARKDTTFTVYVTMHYIDSASGRPKKAKKTQTVECKLLTHSRIPFLNICLDALAVKDVYTPSTDGPPFKIWFSNGKSSAPTISKDDDFARAVRPLWTTRVKTIHIECDVETWMYWRAPAGIVTGNTMQQAVAGPSSALGTVVPAAGIYSSQVKDRASQMRLISDALFCEMHKHLCWIDKTVPTSPHYKASNYHVRNIAVDIETKNGTIEQPSRETIIAMKRSTPVALPKPVAIELLASALAGHKRARSPSPTAARSSPPPEVLDDHLRIALQKFSRETMLLTPGEITAVHTALQAKSYVPQAFASISVEKVIDLTGLDEGKAAALHAFFIKWSAEMEGKRQRRRLV